MENISIASEKAVYGKKIRNLCRNNKVSVRKLAVYLGVTDQAVYRWMDGTVCPSIQNLVGISYVFDISLDELMDNSISPEADPAVCYKVQEMNRRFEKWALVDEVKTAERMKSRCRELRVRQKSLAEALGVSVQSISKYMTGSSLPEAGRLLKLSRLLQLPVDELVVRRYLKAEMYRYAG